VRLCSTCTTFCFPFHSISCAISSLSFLPPFLLLTTFCRSSFYLEVWADSDVEVTGSKQDGGDMPRGKGELDIEVEQVWDDALGKQAVQGVEFEEEEPRDKLGLQGWSRFKAARSRADYVLHPLLVGRMESLEVGELWEQWKPVGGAKARAWFESDKVRALGSRCCACFASAHSRSALCDRFDLLYTYFHRFSFQSSFLDWKSDIRTSCTMVVTLNPSKCKGNILCFRILYAPC
jgi:hypothetical protein